MIEFWTTSKIKEGFERFVQENGRLPSAVEIDAIDYLPCHCECEFSQHDLDNYTASKTRPLPQTTKLITMETLRAYIQTKRTYPNPLK